MSSLYDADASLSALTLPLSPLSSSDIDDSRCTSAASAYASFDASPTSPAPPYSTCIDTPTTAASDSEAFQTSRSPLQGERPLLSLGDRLSQRPKRLAWLSSKIEAPLSPSCNASPSRVLANTNASGVAQRLLEFAPPANEAPLRTATSSPREEPPEPPDLRLDVSQVVLLVPQRVGKERLEPWSDPRLKLPVKRRRTIAPWSLSMESWYRMVHPGVWVILGEEYEKLVGYFGELMNWVERRRTEGAGTEELGELERKRDEAQRGATRIFNRLYGAPVAIVCSLPPNSPHLSCVSVHYLREQYLRHYRRSDVGWDDSKIINCTLTFETRGPDDLPYVIRHADHSVWPLSLPASASPIPVQKPLIVLSNDSYSDLIPYSLHHFDLDWPRNFKPMPMPAYLEAYRLASAARPDAVIAEKKPLAPPDAQSASMGERLPETLLRSPMDQATGLRRRFPVEGPSAESTTQEG